MASQASSKGSTLEPIIEQDRPRLELVTEEPASPAVSAIIQQPTVSAPPSPTPAAIYTTLRTIALILSVRLLLLMILMGAVAMATMAMMNPNPMTLAVLAIYCILAVLPMVWLERGATTRRTS